MVELPYISGSLHLPRYPQDGRSRHLLPWKGGFGGTATMAFASAGGGIGRRARLRALWAVGPWRFKSSPAHSRVGNRGKCLTPAVLTPSDPGATFLVRTNVRIPRRSEVDADAETAGNLGVHRRVRGQARLPADGAGDRRGGWAGVAVHGAR